VVCSEITKTQSTAKDRHLHVNHGPGTCDAGCSVRHAGVSRGNCLYWASDLETS